MDGLVVAGLVIVLVLLGFVAICAKESIPDDVWDDLVGRR